MNKFEAPLNNWIELWKGAILYRSHYKEGKFSDPISLENLMNICNNSKCFKLDFKEIDGTLGFIPKNSKKHSQQSIIRRIGFDYFSLKRLEHAFQNPTILNHYFGEIDKNKETEALKALEGAWKFCNIIKNGFRNALNEGKCSIWARVGEQTAFYTQIPIDIFTNYKIKSWGVPNQRGKAIAVLKGSPTLYAIQVALNIKEEMLRSGAPGRPSSWDNIVEPYFQKRMEKEECKNSISKEALYLSNWLSTKCPEAHQIKPKTMENKIRAQFRDYKTKS